MLLLIMAVRNMYNLIILFFLVISLEGYSQKNIRIDESLKQNIDLENLEAPLELWINFLSSKDDKDGAKFWNLDEIKQNSDSTYFQMNDLDYFELGDKIKNLQYGLTVLSITQKDSIYKITSKFEIAYNDSVSVTPFIFHVYAKTEKSSNSLKLYNPIPINQQLYMSKCKIGFITYIYPLNYNFDKRLAKNQNKRIQKIAREFNWGLSNYNYFFTNDRKSFFELRGYDFHFENIGYETPSGRADVKNKIAFSYGCGEFYPHELIHLFLNPLYPNAHTWFIEGFCTYFGHSRGKSLEWHKQRVKNYLKNHPELNLNNLLELKNMDHLTDYRYVLGGYFIQLAYEKGGANTVKTLLSSGSSDEEFYKALESILGIKKDTLNEYIRTNLN
jgi:hypothetical protein